MPVVLHRLDSLERRVDAGFAHIDDRLDRLAFVRSDVYHAEKRDIERRISIMEKKLLPDGEVAADIADAKRPGIWAVSGIGAAFIIAIVGAIARLALGV